MLNYLIRIKITGFSNEKNLRYFLYEKKTRLNYKQQYNKV